MNDIDRELIAEAEQALQHGWHAHRRALRRKCLAILAGALGFVVGVVFAVILITTTKVVW